MSDRDLTGKWALFVFILIFVFLAAGLITAGYVYFQKHERRYRTEVEHQLSAVAELKVDELVQWRKERLGDGAVYYKNANFSGLVKRFLEKATDKDARGRVQTWLGKIQKAYRYDRVFLLDAQGSTRMAAPETPETVAPHLKQTMTAILRSGRVAFLDFHRDFPDSPIHLAVLVPILDQQDNHRPLGVLVLRIDPRIYLYPLLQRWPTSSQTAETLLLRRDGDGVLFLNELRFRKNTALMLRSSLENTDMPAVKAALGQEGIVEGRDYHGVPVMAALRAVPDSPWFLVARMDAAEVYAPIREWLWVTVVLVGVLILGAGAGVGLIWRHQRSRFYRERYEAAEALRVVSRRQEALLSAIPDIIMEVDHNKVYTWANQPGLEFFGREAVGREAAFYFEGEQGTYQSVQPLFNGSEDIITIESWQRRKDGQKRLLAWWCRVLKDTSGKVIGALSSARDITEQKLAEETLRQKDQELEKRNEELTRFIYTISHDLKSPLVTIRTFLGYLDQDALNQDTARINQDLAYIRNAADKMSQLLDELLELSRIGRVMNPSVEASLQEIAKETLDLVAGQIAERGVAVKVTEKPILLVGDRPRLVEVFQNLIDNAVKFMGDQPAPRVEIGVEEAGEELVLFVRDNGLGIDLRYQPKLFGLFEKLDPRTEGAGIGLALVRRIIEVHGGRIWVESEGPGRGATFRFTLAGTRKG